MFKRSFTTRDRAGKAVKPTKKIYRERTKVKMQERLDSPPVGRLVKYRFLSSSAFVVVNSILTIKAVKSPAP